MHSSALADIAAELLRRPGHEKVRTLCYRLLTEGLGASSENIDFERQVPEVRGRIDALFGRTVIEVKSDLRREDDDARSQLSRYLPEREAATGHRFVGIATDGAVFRAYEMRDGALTLLGADFKPDVAAPRRILEWLEGVVVVQDRHAPDILAIQVQLGRDSIGYQRALSDLRAVWNAVRGNPDARLKRDLWTRLLSIAYGAEIGDDALFLQHTYLTVVAKAIATLALTDTLPDDPRDLMSGAPFTQRGITGAVESDFFDWVLLTPEGAALTRRIAAHTARFDFSRVDVDILKGLYESLIDPSQRHDLGEYYTPDWLAARIVAHAVTNPLEDRVIDPACGSGAFLFHAIRRLLAAAEAGGMPPAEAVARATEKIAGIDVHPVAVIFARATCLLALAPALRRGRPSTFNLPVYLGDALQWSTRDLFNETDLEVTVPQDGASGRVVLRFPFSAAEDPAFLDAALETMLRLGAQGQPAKAFRDWLRSRKARDEDTLVHTYTDLKALQDSGRNHIWGYVARNLSRPVWLASDRRKADVVVGNPPWVAYRSMSQGMQKRFRDAAKTAEIFVGGKSATASDMSAYFFTRAVDLYMRPGGRIAFVLPYAALSRAPYEKFRTGVFRDRRSIPAYVRFTEVWAMPADLQPLFPVPSCVIFAERAKVPSTLPSAVRVFTGQLPRRDANPDQAARALTETEGPWPGDDGARIGSPYRSRFRQGATLVPRRLMIVEEVPVTDRLGANPSRPLVRGRVSNQDKKPWNAIDPIQGPVEREFLRPVLLGESIAPWRVIAPVLGVIPMVEGREAPLDAKSAAGRDASGLSDWLTKAEGLWKTHGTGKMSFGERIDFYRLLRSQFPVAPLRIAFTKAGTQAAAVLVHDVTHVIDHKLYWSAVETEAEGRYLCAIFNSETTRARVERWQSMGQWGARDFDKVMFNLPIPLFDARDPSHAALAAAGARAEALAASVALTEGEHFTRARARIRRALAEDGIAGRIDAAVAALLDR